MNPFIRHLVCLLGLMGAEAAWSQSSPQASTVHALPVSSRLSFENITLPGGESMGMLGGSYLMSMTPHWLAGPAVYGAATGHRGGFFVGGAELAYRLPVGTDWRVEAGLFAGGGGGGAAPVGGGLMLRPHLDLLWRVGDQGVWAGLSASSVRFPDGQIRSSQAGLVLSVDSDFVYTLPSSYGGGGPSAQRGGMGFDRISVTGTSDHPSDGAGNIGLVGFRLAHWMSPRSYWGLEAAGAASGGVAGYAEVLGTVGVEQPISGTSLAVGARAALGVGGGGAVPTDGGLLAKAGVSVSWHISRDLFVSLEGGAVTTPQGSFHARYGQLAVGWELDHPSQGPSTWSRVASFSVTEDMEWDLALENVGQAARKDGSHQAYQSVGLQVRTALNDAFYLSGQAHSAFSGQAGAYSVGLVGLGVETPGLGHGVSAGLEMLVGAAGGGGVDTQGGAVIQPMVKLNWEAGPQSRFHVGVGRIRSIKGVLDSPVVELAWGLAFGVPTR
jgi:hypothetical protein